MPDEKPPDTPDEFTDLLTKLAQRSRRRRSTSASARITTPPKERRAKPGEIAQPKPNQ